MSRDSAPDPLEERYDAVMNERHQLHHDHQRYIMNGSDEDANRVWRDLQVLEAERVVLSEAMYARENNQIH